MKEVKLPYGKHNELLFFSMNEIVHIKGAEIFKEDLPFSFDGLSFDFKFYKNQKLFKNSNIGIRPLGNLDYHFKLHYTSTPEKQSPTKPRSKYFNRIWSKGKELTFSEFYKNIPNEDEIVPVYRAEFPLYVLQNWAIWKQTDSGFKPINLDEMTGFRELKMADIDSEGNLWVYQNNIGLIKVDTAGNPEQIQFKLKTKLGNHIMHFAITEANGIVFGNEQELIHYKNGEFVKIKEFSTPKIFSLATWKNSVIIGSDEGFEIVE